MSQAYQPLHHKYRPERFNALVGQEAIAATLTQALITKRIAPAYLFTGPRGTGKTSSARILARSLNCISGGGPTPEPCGKCEICKTISSGTSLDVIEIDAASNTGVDNIRELIERSRFAPVQARWKVYVIDECHMLSTAAFNALLKTLEEPPPQVVFVLATTDPQRVLPTILSRCQRFDFRRIPIDALEKHLKMIASVEAISIEPEALHLIAQRAGGGLRDAESMLDQLSLLPAPIKANAVWDLLGAVPEQELLKLAAALAKKDPLSILESCRHLLDRGRDPSAILQGLATVLRDLVLFRAAPDRPELSNLSPQSHSQLADLAHQVTLEKLLQWQSQLKGTEYQLRQSVQPRLWLEILLLGILAEPDNPSSRQPSISSEHAQSSTPISIKKTSLIRPTNSDPNKTPNPIPRVSEKFSTPKSDQTQTESSSENNLSELWQQILASLELPSTRMLLSQQAKLIRLNSNLAVVQVAENWMGMVESRANLLGKAIEKATGHPRELILESQINPPKQKQPRQEEKLPIKKTLSGSTEPVKSQPNEPLTQSSAQNELKPQTHYIQADPDQPSKQIETIDSKVKRLAEFFNGQVLDKDP